MGGAHGPPYRVRSRSPASVPFGAAAAMAAMIDANAGMMTLVPPVETSQGKFRGRVAIVAYVPPR